jgi:hypothetical protein
VSLESAPPSPEPPPVRWVDPPLEAWARCHAEAEAKRFHAAVVADLDAGVAVEKALAAVAVCLRRLTRVQRSAVRARLNDLL